jgi:predicted MFS family arabinose efflux permease
VLALFAVPLLDELATGVVPASAGEIARDLWVPGGIAAGAIITAYHALALFVETPLLAWSERVSPRWFSVGCLVVLALSTLGAALSTHPLALALALTFYGPASGGAVSVAEGLLVESRPLERERTLARINLAGALGDLGVPIVLAALSMLGLGWRPALVGIAAVAALLAAVHARSPEIERMLEDSTGEDEKTEEGETEEEEPSIFAALRLAFGTPRLLGWAFAITLTSLLDEVLIAFAVVRMDAASTLERAMAVGAWTAGMLGGLAVLERRIDRMDGTRVLLASCAVAAAALVVLAMSDAIEVAVPAMAVLGAATSSLHPLVSARAYASLPGRPALVNAVSSALAPIDAVAPLLLAAIAITWGPAAALLAIGLAPIGIALMARRAR